MPSLLGRVVVPTAASLASASQLLAQVHPFLLALWADSDQGSPRPLAGCGLSLPCALPSAPLWFCLGSGMGLGSHLPAKLRAAGGWSLPCLPPPGAQILRGTPQAWHSRISASQVTLAEEDFWAVLCDVLLQTETLRFIHMGESWTSCNFDGTYGSSLQKNKQKYIPTIFFLNFS